MYLYVELWSPKPAWFELSVDERHRRVMSVESSVNSMLESGVTLLGSTVADIDTPNRAGHRFVAVWQMPSIESAHRLEKGLAESGWYEFFDQVNERGPLTTLAKLLGNMAELT